MTRCCGSVLAVSRASLARILARPFVWLSLVAAIGVCPGITLGLPAGVLRVPTAETAEVAVHLASWCGIAWGIVASAEQRWATRMLSDGSRVGVELALIAACGATFGAAAAASTLFATSTAQSAARELTVLWTGCALATLLLQLGWRASATLFAFAALTWIVPACLPAGAVGGGVLDSVCSIAQHLSPAASYSDKSAVAPLDLAPGAAMLMAAWLTTRPATR